jgi:Glutathione S-transferase
MIELFSSDTPNGKKIGIMLEEIGFEYKVTKLDLAKGDQFKPEFKKISPFAKYQQLLIIQITIKQCSSLGQS